MTKKDTQIRFLRDFIMSQSFSPRDRGSNSVIQGSAQNTGNFKFKDDNKTIRKGY